MAQNPKISTRTLAAVLKEKIGVIVCHETVRQTLLQNKYSSRSALKKPPLSAAKIEKRFLFAIRYLAQNDCWDDVIFCDETKTMLYYNDGLSRVWCKLLTAGKQQKNHPNS